MAIKATFLSGRNDTTTESLYQWDYGQELEIEFPDLGSLLCEVHFACNGMSEAIVRPCTLSAGIGDVTIPDECLEQSSKITAWIYEKGVDNPHGRTRGVITIPVVARARPGVVRDIPPETNDQYALLIAEVNDAINDIENGVVKAKYAVEADTAKEATHAGNASTATHAIGADRATTADRATKADQADSATHARYARTTDGDIDLGHSIHTYEGQGFKTVPTKTNGRTPMLGGVIIFNIETLDDCSFVMELPQGVAGFSSPLFPVRLDDKTTGYIVNMIARLAFSYTEVGYVVELQTLKDGFWIPPESETDVYIRYKHIGRQYPYIP